MKKVSVIILSLGLFVLLSSCYYPRYKKSVYYNGRKDLLVAFTYTVPFIYDSGIEMRGDVELYPVETDEYGRTLGILQFNSTQRNPLFGENAVYCILQCGSSEESCFYEDICCTMVENGTDPMEQIEQLKEDNDWNMPLVLGKCRKIPIQYSSAGGIYDTQYGYRNYKETACNAVDWEVSTAWLEVLCKDGCGLWLFTLEKDSKEKDSPICLIMMKETAASAESPILSVLETRILKNRYSPWIEIRAFKQDTGWAFVDRNQ